MDFSLDTETEALRDAVRGLLGKSYASSEDRRAVVKEDPGFDEKLWTRLAEMGVLGLPFAEEDGGFGAGPVEVSVVAEELGRVIAPEPFVESVVLAGGLVAAAGSGEQRADLLGRLAAGEVVLAAALGGDVRWEDGTLSGAIEPVLNGGRADVLVVEAVTEAGTGLFVVQGDAEGVTRTSYPTFDGGRAARVELSNVAAEPLGDVGTDQGDALARIVAAAQIAYSHEAVGAMSTALTTTSEYLKTRKQFGVTLNTFQALTFRAADLYVSLELARSVASWATLVLADEPERAVEAAHRARLQISRASRHIGQEAIQLHGGIGMTAEYSVGHFTSRLTAIDHWLGDGDTHLGVLSADIADYGVLNPIPE